MTRNIWGACIFIFVFWIFGGIFNKTIVPLALVEYEMIPSG